MDRPVIYLFPYVDEHLAWLDRTTKYSIIREQGEPKYISFASERDAFVYKLKWTKNENN